MKNIFYLIMIFFVSSVLAFPKAPFNALDVNTLHLNIENLNLNFDFEGIVKLSNCSGAVVKFSGQPMASKALVLTNGHCVKPWGFLKPGEVWINKNENRKMKVANKNRQFHLVNSTKIIYATMTHTDAAIYELEQSYADLQKIGIEAFLLSFEHPQIGTEIEIVSGYWEHGYSCNIDDFIYMLKEGEWTFLDSIRYSALGCDVIGGTSGSPIIQKGTRTVVGVNNTGNESGYQCSINNPCEVDEQGNVTVNEGRGYGQQTFNFYNCLTPDFKINPNLRTCNLPQ